jgi:hypothetical protein
MPVPPGFWRDMLGLNRGALPGSDGRAAQRDNHTTPWPLDLVNKYFTFFDRRVFNGCCVSWVLVELARYHPMAVQKRRHARKAFDHVAALDLGDGSASVACEILDISDRGARLQPLMCAPQTIPDTFTLWLSACGKVRRTCNVAWRSKTELGVQFRKT